MRVSRRRFVTVCAVIALSITSSSFAATLTKISDDALAPLRATTVAKKIRLDKLPLYDGKRSVIELEQFQVWAPGAKVVIHDGEHVTRQDPPPMRFFRGPVNGDPESFAYFSVDGRTGRIQGLIVVGEQKFAVDGAERRQRSDPRPRNRTLDDGRAGGGFDYFLTALDQSDQTPMTGETWQCAVDMKTISPKTLPKVARESDASGMPLQSQGVSGTQSYSIAVEIETDNELYVNAGNNASTVTTYATNLTGAVSTIYNRDIKTNVMQNNVHVYTSAADPWADRPTGDTQAALYELGTYYHANYPTASNPIIQGPGAGAIT